MKGPRIVTVFCLIGVSTLWGIAPAAAQSDQELAKTYYNLGEDLYNRSDYEGALKQFKQSYKYSQQPALLFNMARCFESLGQQKAAIEHYSRFLKSKPPNAGVIEMRIKNLERLLEKKQHSPVKQPPPPEAVPVPAPRETPPEQPEAAPEFAAPEEAADEEQDEAATGGRPLRLPGWIMVGSGAALAITGVILGASASAKQSELEDANKAGLEFADVQGTEDSGKALETGAIITLVIGGVAAATGAVLLILDAKRSSGEQRAWIAPSLIQGGAVVAGGLRF